MRLAVRYWEIHRHRIAEKTAASLNEYFNDERLEVRKGSVVSMIGQMDGGIGLKLLSGEELHADWVVLCTGPSEHATHNNLPIASLEKQGIVVPGAFHMGLRCEPETGAVIGVDGLYSHQIYVVGPLRKGELWESTAIPEIHVQADALGKLLVQ